MLSLVSAVMFVLLGFAVTSRQWLRDDDQPAGVMERVTLAAVAGLSVWLGSSWILALTGTLTRAAVLARLAVLAAVLLVVAYRRREDLLRFLHGRHLPPHSAWTAVAFLPLLLWIVFILWRGAIIPPVSHDALSYHLPKATLISRAAGYEHFEFLHAAIRSTPVNYELLLAEEIAVAGNDGHTEWLSVVFYLLVAVAAGALAERFWRASGPGPVAAMLAVVGAPVVLLHSGAHKNDLMVAFFMVAAGVAAGRWITTSDLRAFVLMAAAFGGGIGTKPQAAALAVCALPFVTVPAVRAVLRRGWRVGVLLLIVSVAAFLLLGGAVYVGNFLHEGGILDAKQGATETVEIIPYGDWANLWQGPWVLVAAPFSRSSFALSVPWSSNPWFWRPYEIYFSHLGVIFSLCAIALPFALVALARGGGEPRARYERVVLTIAFTAAFAVMLPVGFKPHGLYTISLPRYALFFVPVVFAWTLVPLVDLAGKVHRRGALALLLAIGATYAVYAAKSAENDTFAPLEYVFWARGVPGTRAPAFDANRAASVVDRRAGPHDTIALDAAYGTWIHPAFGADLQRPVVFIPPGGGPPRIGDDVDWVAIDRAYEIVWGHPDFRDLGDARRYLLRGKPSADALRVMEHLERRSDFERVFYNQSMLQAVYRRRAGGTRR